MWTRLTLLVADRHSPPAHGREEEGSPDMPLVRILVGRHHFLVYSGDIGIRLSG